MSFLQNMIASAKKTINSYSGDSVFLKAVASATANVTAADGKIEDNEMEAAISGMQANPIVSASFNSSQIEEAYQAALVRAKSRAGRMENKRNIEALMTRDISVRQDVFLIAADTADQGEIGPEEKAVLQEIGKLLNVDADKMLG